MTPHINYWAVLVAAVANFVIGSLWYGPLFGKAWSNIVGRNMEQKPPASKIARGMILTFVGSLLMAYILDNGLIFATTYLGLSGAINGIQGAFWYWLGFVAPVTLGPVLWENKPWKLWFINAGYYLISMCIMGVILLAWK